MIKYKTKITFVDVVNDKLRNCFYIIFTGWIAGGFVLIVEIVVHRKLYRKMKWNCKITNNEMSMKNE